MTKLTRGNERSITPKLLTFARKRQRVSNWNETWKNSLREMDSSARFHRESAINLKKGLR